MKKDKRIFLSPPHMSGRELDFIREAFEGNWIAPSGPDLEAFEMEFLEYLGASFGVALSSGTAAIHLALLSLGVGPGDEVLCPTFTFSATVNPIAYAGASPVFVDCDERSWNIDPYLLRGELDRLAGLGRLPRAVIFADIYGQSADVDPIMESCGRYDVPVIEDACEALGATYKGKKCGSFGLCAAFSFNGNKIITTSGGGMLVSEEEEMIKKARYLSTQAKDDTPHYQHSNIGYNYRLSNILAAIGRAQISVIEERIAQTRGVNRLYRELLGDLPGVDFMPEADYGKGTNWLTCITIDPEKFGADRERVRLRLEEENIESRPLWMPMHMQPIFSGRRKVGGEISERLFRNGLSLPSGSDMTHEDVRRVSEVIASTKGN
ncbi:MAG: aminotransferase class I/II-fold pyridoxal phosphate-dependent enzyme [Deltaproteobacteria bacterium]|uniref:Aminotransferase class I/II-fold pyridoxal phosphate-dependent enzyme n=1 Tax=Candidatus Zymogenus saltonus TaxID=2844893 RepID=A0A9D8PSN7_9DELT|nr:aminotransferase class I/II-fold pyridoxal phosphate-dependent enzyme [Candidatus Zymogenus saltonus]